MMGRRSFVKGLIAAVLAMVAPAVAVRPSSKIIRVGPKPWGDFETLTEAINHAGPGYTLMVSDGHVETVRSQFVQTKIDMGKSYVRFVNCTFDAPALS